MHGEETVDCAVCQNPMITLELDNVETDYCLVCRGIWLDTGELELLLGDSEKAREVLRSFQPLQNTQENLRRCPICGKKMEKVLVGPESSSILLDRCRKGHGLWFDRGELEAVLQMGRFDSQKKIPSFLGKMFKNPETNPNQSDS
jgi:hypothetical protein